MQSGRLSINGRSYRKIRDVPDVSAFDISFCPEWTAFQGIKILKERYPKMLILMITVYDDDERILMLCAGANGYLLKRTPPMRLLESLRKRLMEARRCRRK